MGLSRVAVNRDINLVGVNLTTPEQELVWPATPILIDGGQYTIRLTLMTYVHYSLLLRQVEDLLRERRTDISHQKVRTCLRKPQSGYVVFFFAATVPIRASDFRRRQPLERFSASMWALVQSVSWARTLRPI
jgi:hypothetical protein